MNERKCDRCGEFYEEYGVKFAGSEPNGILYATLYDDRTYYSSKSFDLCPECMDELKKWIGSDDDGTI